MGGNHSSPEVGVCVHVRGCKKLSQKRLVSIEGSVNSLLLHTSLPKILYSRIVCCRVVSRYPMPFVSVW